MGKIIFLFLALVLLVGCSSKGQEEFLRKYEKRKNHYSHLQKTEKVQLYKEDRNCTKEINCTKDEKDIGTTKVLLTATYLYTPTLNTDDKRDEVFVVGMYAEDSEIQQFNKEGFSLTLEGKKEKKNKRNKRKKKEKKSKFMKPISITLLNKNSPYLKNISFVTDWNKFYLVHFPHSNKKQFKLKFKSAKYGEGTLRFAKAAKYTFSKKAF